MRFDVQNARWIRARRLLRDANARLNARRFFGRKASFDLGEFGVDTNRGLVWGVMDVDGRYAIGGLQTPEPMSFFLLGSGLAVLGLARWRRQNTRREP